MPKTEVHERLCASCNIIEDEKHFLIHRYSQLREKLFTEVIGIVPEFKFMCADDMFCFLLCNMDGRILTLVGKFIHNAFLIRNN